MNKKIIALLLFAFALSAQSANCFVGKNNLPERETEQPTLFKKGLDLTCDAIAVAAVFTGIKEARDTLGGHSWDSNTAFAELGTGALVAYIMQKIK